MKTKLKLSESITDIKQPSGDNRRNANYTLLKAFDLFESIAEIPDDDQQYCGNIQSSVMGMPDADNIGLNGIIYPKTKLASNKSFYDQVSAPMLLARLVSAGCKVSVEGQDGYKVTWQVILKHKKTGHIIYFYDWKGGPSFGSNADGMQSKQFIKDVVKLINTLTDAQFPHPYDGCVVGEIA